MNFLQTILDNPFILTKIPSKKGVSLSDIDTPNLSDRLYNMYSIICEYSDIYNTGKEKLMQYEAELKFIKDINMIAGFQTKDKNTQKLYSELLTSIRKRQLSKLDI
jgi:hypothetical protein